MKDFKRMYDPLASGRLKEDIATHMVQSEEGFVKDLEVRRAPWQHAQHSWAFSFCPLVEQSVWCLKLWPGATTYEPMPGYLTSSLSIPYLNLGLAGASPSFWFFLLFFSSSLALGKKKQ